MGFRTVYGNSYGENGWPFVDEASCQWVTVPGTSVSLQIQQGQPLAILRAFAADFNAFVEPLRDTDSACWTPTNSVSTSNHLGGTACDLNWNSHPFLIANAGFTPQKIDTIREMLDFYEGTVFWGNDWNSPKDAMHFQMGYDTYQNTDTASFIARKIRSDGYSTFRRGPISAQPMIDPVNVLSAATGLSYSRAEEILPQVSEGLVNSQCTTKNRIAMWLAQIGHESDGFNATEEYASGDESLDRWKYKGRTWIQITWQANYAGFSQWAYDNGLVSSSDYFVIHPTRLSDQKWAGLGPAWYWTIARPGINAMCDNGDLVGVTKVINGGINGLPDRQSRYSRAINQGDKLLVLLSDNESEEGFLMSLSDAEQREVLDLLRQQAGYRRISRSPLRHVGEKEVETIAGFAWNTDGSVHVLLINLLARLGDPDALSLLREVASLDQSRYPDRAHDKMLAQAILNDINGVATVDSAGATGQVPGVTMVAPVAPAAVVSPVAPPAPVAPPPSPSPAGGDGIRSSVGTLGAEISSLKELLSSYVDQLRS